MRFHALLLVLNVINQSEIRVEESSYLMPVTRLACPVVLAIRRRFVHNQMFDFLDWEAIAPLAGRFDLVFCFDTLEHILNPFKFCEHLIYITRPGGYVYVATVLEWPYHPSPEDYFRFSPSGLRKCFISPLNCLGREPVILECNWGSDGKGVFLFGQRSHALLDNKKAENLYPASGKSGSFEGN